MTRLLLLSVFAVACASPSGPCEDTGGVRGEWTYLATQDAPSATTLHGSMVISTSRCADFQGVLDVVEVLPTGESRRVSGPVSGTVLDSTLVRFEAVVGGAREHLARLRGDSLTGDWIQALSGGAAASGRFAGRRRGPS